MARILLAWEYGSGMGHVAILMPIAKRLQQDGHHITIALRDTKAATSETESSGMTIIPAPFIRPTSFPKNYITHTLADIFCSAGIDNPDALGALAYAWDSILSENDFDLVINEFSPTLALAALDRIPVITLGTGYSIPPANMSLPNIRFWHKPLRRESIRNEREIFTTAQSIRKSLKLPPLRVFSDLFHGEGQYVCTYPLLDCYRNYRTTPAIGSLNPQLYTNYSPQNQYGKNKIFAYLNAELANIDTIITGIKASKIPCEAYIRGLAPEKRIALSDELCVLHKTPQALPDILPECSLCIHHGGISTAELCLRYGVPQFVLANHLEQRVNGSALCEAGVAALITLNQTNDSQLINHTIVTLAHNKSTYEKVTLLARKLADSFSYSPLDSIVEHCHMLLDDKRVRLTL